MDEAGLLSSSFQNRMNQVLTDVMNQGGPQIGILTLASLEGESIEQSSIRVADQWQLGDKTKDDGVIILVAQKERRVRIEVGQGLEGDLTDLESSRIINQLMLPLFKQGEIESGLWLAAARITQVTAPQLPLDRIFGDSQEAFQAPKASNQSARHRWPIILIFVVFVILFLRYPRFFLLMLLASRSRGGWGGGGFGGGGSGWGGRGGGFSGGGASGGW
jgi:uncharacterized protein